MPEENIPPPPLSTELFQLAEVEPTGQWPCYMVVRISFDGVTTTRTEVGSVLYDDYRQQWSGMGAHGRTRYVADPRITFDDLVRGWFIRNTNPAVEAAFMSALSTQKLHHAECARAERERAEAAAMGERYKPRTRHLLRTQTQYDQVLRMLAHILAAVSPGAVMSDGTPSPGLAESELERWKARNPNE